ncbi:hypothetical protein M3Y98_00717200 [Aphelenchoides besseyi]|nr:hypothetical protein M3Y98_00717200 [Aphelenchoides besseyi]KAI6210273.1 hypothetical protein M3Y96_00310600 [Aphelenchoides besseyi]
MDDIRNELYSIIASNGDKGITLNALGRLYEEVWSQKLDDRLQKLGFKDIREFLSNNYADFTLRQTARNEQILFITEVRPHDREHMSMIVETQDEINQRRTGAFRRYESDPYTNLIDAYVCENNQEEYDDQYGMVEDPEYGALLTKKRLKHVPKVDWENPMKYTNIISDLEKMNIGSLNNEQVQIKEAVEVEQPKEERVKQLIEQPVEQPVEKLAEKPVEAKNEEVEEVVETAPQPNHHVATRTMRDKSPCIYRVSKNERLALKKPQRRFAMFPDGPEKIHRIILPPLTVKVSQYVSNEDDELKIEVNVVNLVSPSCIWVQRKEVSPKVHRQQLEMCTMRKPFHLVPATTKEEKLILYSYYMAPRLTNPNDRDFVYSRVRLLLLKKRSYDLWAFVHFIDYGYGCWLIAKSLAKLPPRMTGVPWLCIPVALFGVLPLNYDENGSHWTDEHSKILRSLFSEFSDVAIQPVVYPNRMFGYDDYTRADFWVRKDTTKDKNKTEDDTVKTEKYQFLRGLFLQHCSRNKNAAVKLDRMLDSAPEQQLFPKESEIPQPPKLVRDLPVFCTKFPDPEDIDDAFKQDTNW